MTYKKDLPDARTASIHYTTKTELCIHLFHPAGKNRGPYQEKTYPEPPGGRLVNPERGWYNQTGIS